MRLNLSDEKDINSKYGLVDCHVHLTNKILAKNIDHYLDLSLKSGVQGFINSGFKQFFYNEPRLSEKKSFIKTAVGISHLFANEEIFFDTYNITLEEGIKFVYDWSILSDVIAIGEIGLERENIFWTQEEKINKYKIISSNRNYRLPSMNEQIYLFDSQLRIAERVNLPVIIHCENADDVLVSLLQKYEKKHIRGMIHGFCKGLHIAKKYREKGLFLSLNFSILYPENIEALRAVKEMGLGNFVLETDAPGFPPPRSKKGIINFPSNLPHFAELLRKELEMSEDDFYGTLSHNVNQLFGIKFN